MARFPPARHRRILAGEGVNVRALIADGSELMRVMLGQMLTQAGFEVVEATHGGEALDLLAAVGGADVALVAWDVPGTGWREFVSSIRREREYDRTRIVVIVSPSRGAVRDEAVKARADAYIATPFTIEALLTTLETLGLRPAPAGE